MLKLAVIFALSIIIPLSLSVYNDTCVDPSFCGGEGSCENIRLKCPRKCRACSTMRMILKEEKAIDERKPQYECENGWSKVIGNQIIAAHLFCVFCKHFPGCLRFPTLKITERGAMKSMTGQINSESVTGKSMYIYGYDYGVPSYVYFESKDVPQNILFYMELDLVYRRILLSKRNDGKWNNYAVYPLVLPCPESYAALYQFWMIELRFGEDNGRQYIDVMNGIDEKTVCRFYPDDRVKKGDRYYFTQTGYNVLGVTWSNDDFKTFESGLPVDFEIQLIGKILKDHVTIALTKKNSGPTAIIVFRRGKIEQDTEVEVTMRGIITKSKCDRCSYAQFHDDTVTVITIRRTNGGFEIWHKGVIYATVNNRNINVDDIKKIQVISGFQTYGISVLDCQTSKTQ
ncbi:hypothetical protein AB6A40_002783 [Gnathostoma spinigerum]|uniref:Uncharacterized protein n=1 Tax=Gnathostoma spinigerum TaxID=75299 RepID=A0ABD6ED44_9BILA